MNRENMASVVGLLVAGTFAIYGLGKDGIVLEYLNKRGTMEVSVPVQAEKKEETDTNAAAAPAVPLPEEEPAAPAAAPDEISVSDSGLVLDSKTASYEFDKALLKHGIAQESDVRSQYKSDTFRKTALYAYALGWKGMIKDMEEKGMPPCRISSFDAAAILERQERNVTTRTETERKKPLERQFLGMGYEGDLYDTENRDSHHAYRSAYRPAVSFGEYDAGKSCKTGQYISVDRLMDFDFFPDK